jgi:hypothetical protein
MRRLIAFCLVLLTAASNLEAVVGMLRDGEVHHEELSAASLHATPDGEHGHEDASSPAGHQHDENHEHGTSGDHCTHVHGMALIPTFAFAVLMGEDVTQYAEVTQPHPIISRPFTHPPRV